MNWVVAHAGGELRPAGLSWLGHMRGQHGIVAGEQRSTRAAKRCLGDAGETCRLLPSISEALTHFDERASELLYRQREISTANVAEEEASRSYWQVCWHAAPILVEWIVFLRLRSEDKSHPRILKEDIFTR